MRKFALVFFVVLIVLLTGCRRAGSGTPAATQPEPQKTAAVQGASPTQPSASSTGEQPYPYPVPQTYVTRTPRTYPEPQANVVISTATPVIVPTAGKDTAVVTGVLLNTETKEPLAFQSIYLGIRVHLTPGPGYTYALQEASSPHAISGEDGKFAIGNVPPGDYILMVFTPFGASVVMQPNSDRELDIKVTAGQVLDIGTMEAVEPTLR